MEPFCVLGFKLITDQKGRTDNLDVFNINSNMPHYFSSSTNRDADKGTSQLTTQRMQIELNDVLQEHGFAMHI